MGTWQVLALVVLVLVLIVGTVVARRHQAVAPWLLTGGVSAVLAGALVILIPMANRDDANWQAWCASQGGQVTDHVDVSTITTVSGKGRPGAGVGVGVTRYCISADGRLLGVA